MKAISMASVLAIVLTASVAHAAPAMDATTDANGDMPASTYQKTDGRTGAKEGTVMHDVQKNLSNANEEMRETADDIKAFLIGDKAGGTMEPVMIHRNMTAHGMIGESVLSPDGKNIAKVKDIIIGSDGKASMIVLDDGGFLGIGTKVAAFDYSKVVSQKSDGKIVMALTQDMIDSAADFSYDPKDQRTAKVIPQGSISAKDILDGHLLDYKGKNVANIDNISFANGKAERIIVSFDKKLGMGGKLAALNYDALEMVKKDDAVNFRMNQEQSSQFSNLKVSARK